MSSLHISLNGCGTRDRKNGSNADRLGSSPVDSGGCADVDVLRRVANLSLLRASGNVLVASEAEEDSSQVPTESFGIIASAPLSPTSASITSFDFEGISSSDLLSPLSPQPSLYSLTESLKEQAIRWEYGRGLNTHSSVYRLAADEDEAERLNKEHHVYKVVLGEYVPPLREVLEDNDPFRPKACLDIGCGSGAWILEVASAFPHVSCTGVDLVPLPAILGLEHFAGEFDVVHARHVSSGIRDYYRLIDDAALALRPRGLANFTENDWRVYDIDKRPIISTTREIWGSFEPPEGWTGTGMARSGASPVRTVPKLTCTTCGPSPFVARFANLARQAARKRGAHVDVAALLHRWFSEHPAYEDVSHREAWLPVGNWLDNLDSEKYRLTVSSMTKEEIARFRWIGREKGEDILEFMRSARPLLLSTGVPDALVDSITEKASQEIREACAPLYIRVNNVYARKKIRREDINASSAR